MSVPITLTKVFNQKISVYTEFMATQGFFIVNYVVRVKQANDAVFVMICKYPTITYLGF
jgi:hypothetical protein